MGPIAIEGKPDLVHLHPSTASSLHTHIHTPSAAPRPLPTPVDDIIDAATSSHRSNRAAADSVLSDVSFYGILRGGGEYFDSGPYFILFLYVLHIKQHHIHRVTISMCVAPPTGHHATRK